MRIPPLKRHEASGQGRVWIGGRYVYLGIFGSPQCEAKYRETIAAWLRRSGQAGPVTINQIVAEFLGWADRRYRKTRSGGEATAMRYALRPLQELHGTRPAMLFGPRELREVQEEMIRRRWVRRSINRQINRIRRVFRWAYSDGLIPHEVYDRLRALEPLKAGDARVKEKARVRAVAWEDVHAIAPHVPPTVWDMIRVLAFTGMRIGELVDMTPAALDMGDPEVWIYSVDEHKTAHQIEEPRAIAIGPQAREIVARHLRAEPNAPIFLNGAGKAYTPKLVWKLIRSACDRAGVPRWNTHRLRHLAGTAARLHFGIDGTKAILGQRSTQVAEGYAELDPLAREVARRIG